MARPGATVLHGHRHRVAGVPDATSRLTTGEIVTVDGAAGAVSRY